MLKYVVYSSTKLFLDKRRHWQWDEIVLKRWGSPVATLEVWGRSEWACGLEWLKSFILQSSPTSFSGLWVVTDFSDSGSHPCPLRNTNWVNAWQDSLSGTSKDSAESLNEGHWWGQRGRRAYTLLSRGRKNKESIRFKTAYWLRLSHPKHHEWVWSGKGWRGRAMTKISKINEIE